MKTVKLTSENIFKTQESPLGKENAKVFYQICAALTSDKTANLRENIADLLDMTAMDVNYKTVRQILVDSINTIGLEETKKQFELIAENVGIELKYKLPTLKTNKKEVSKKPIFTPMVALKQQIEAKKEVKKVAKKVAETPKQNNVFEAMNKGQITPKQILHLNKLGLISLTSEEIEAINTFILIQG